MSNGKKSKFKLFFDYEKELEYINEMNRLGWKLERVKLGCFYSFIKTEPEEYTTLMYAEKKSRLEETSALARRCGYETIPHSSDGMDCVLYLTGRRDEVSPVFYADEHSLLRAYHIMFRRFFIMSAVCLALTIAIIAELVTLFIIPMISSGQSAGEYPLFFTLTIIFSVIALIFCVLTAYLIHSVFKVKNKMEAMIKDRREKQRKKEASAVKVFEGHSITKE